MTDIATAPTTEPERWLSLTAAARWIGCSREHALKLAALGKIRTRQQAGESLKFNPGDIARIQRGER